MLQFTSHNLYVNLHLRMRVVNGLFCPIHSFFFTRYWLGTTLLISLPAHPPLLLPTIFSLFGYPTLAKLQKRSNSPARHCHPALPRFPLLPAPSLPAARQRAAMASNQPNAPMGPNNSQGSPPTGGAAQGMQPPTNNAAFRPLPNVNIASDMDHFIIGMGSFPNSRFCLHCGQVESPEHRANWLNCTNQCFLCRLPGHVHNGQVCSHWKNVRGKSFWKKVMPFGPTMTYLESHGFFRPPPPESTTTQASGSGSVRGHHNRGRGRNSRGHGHAGSSHVTSSGAVGRPSAPSNHQPHSAQQPYKVEYTINVNAGGTVNAQPGAPSMPPPPMLPPHAGYWPADAYADPNPHALAPAYDSASQYSSGSRGTYRGGHRGRGSKQWRAPHYEQSRASSRDYHRNRSPARSQHGSHRSRSPARSQHGYSHDQPAPPTPSPQIAPPPSQSGVTNLFDRMGMATPSEMDIDPGNNTQDREAIMFAHLEKKRAESKKAMEEADQMLANMLAVKEERDRQAKQAQAQASTHSNLENLQNAADSQAQTGGNLGVPQQAAAHGEPEDLRGVVQNQDGNLEGLQQANQEPISLPQGIQDDLTSIDAKNPFCYSKLNLYKKAVRSKIPEHDLRVMGWLMDQPDAAKVTLVKSGAVRSVFHQACTNPSRRWGTHEFFALPGSVVDAEGAVRAENVPLLPELAINHFGHTLKPLLIQLSPAQRDRLAAMLLEVAKGPKTQPQAASAAFFST